MLKIQLKNNPAKGHWLVGERLRIGVHGDNDLRLQGAGIADFHLEIGIQGERLTLFMPGGSCQVNGRPGREGQNLVAGDIVRLGQSELVVIDPKQIPAAPSTSAAKPVQGWGLSVDHPELQHRRFELKGPMVLGRAEDCEISLPYKLLSRRHAKLTPVAEGIELEDLQSSNGTQVNGQRISKVLLKAGDSFQVAKLQFTVNAPTAILNQTMIRPALTQEVIAAAMQSGKYPALDVEPMNAEADERSGVATAGGSRSWLLPLVGLVLAAVVAAAVWFGF